MHEAYKDHTKQIHKKEAERAEESTLAWLLQEVECYLQRQHADLNRGRALRTTIELSLANQRAAPAIPDPKKNDFCIDFQKKGKCRRGDKCRLKHDKGPGGAKKATPATKNNAKKTKVKKGDPATHSSFCFAFSRGKCFRTNCSRNHKPDNQLTAEEREARSKHARSQSKEPR